ncbi:MAG: hypothetical protein GX621_14205, partial [Pirellulaceae bacterium]|nr:hypothetical protein [Pirellulaceae bacterium]
MARLHHRLARAVVLLILITVAILALDWWRTLPADAVAEYVGRDACLDCHAVEYALWAGSDHDRAMAIATDETVLGDFNDAEHEHFGVRSRMFRRDGKFLVHTDDPDGQMRDFEVKYVFGVRPLQQYLVEFPDGRVQCLPLAWDTERKRWFHLYPNEAIPHNDFL